MAVVNLVFEHGQSPEVARAKFHGAIRELHSQFPGWIHRLDWAEDGRAATLGGTGFEVRCWYDERDLHIEGSIPLAWKLLESTIRSRVNRHIHRALPT
jgi:hypothetical protein